MRYTTGPLPEQAYTDRFQDLKTGLDWIRHPRVPRHEYFCSRVGLPYAYGREPFRRTYEPQTASFLISQIWHEAEVTSGVKFDACFLNRYDDGSDHLGWHSDDSPEMDDTRPIAIVTLMEHPHEAREIWFRPIEEPDRTMRIKLASGSTLLMLPGMQDTHQHRIPKAGFRCGGRISLTFRGYVQPPLVEAE